MTANAERRELERAVIEAAKAETASEREWNSLHAVELGNDPDEIAEWQDSISRVSERMTQDAEARRAAVSALLATEASGEGQGAAVADRNLAQGSLHDSADREVRPAMSNPVAPSLPAPDLPPGYFDKHGWLCGPNGDRIWWGSWPELPEKAWAHYGRALHASLAERDARVRAEQREADVLRLEAIADKLSETADGLSEIGNLQAAADYDQKASAVRDSAAALRSGADGRDKK